MAKAKDSMAQLRFMVIVTIAGFMDIREQDAPSWAKDLRETAKAAVEEDTQYEIVQENLREKETKAAAKGTARKVNL